MKKEDVLEALSAIKKLCKSRKECTKCGLNDYCEHRRVYGAPELFPHFKCNTEIAIDNDRKIVFYDMDLLFNTLNSICSRTLLCDECILKQECDSTCGFTIIPEYWNL